MGVAVAAAEEVLVDADAEAPVARAPFPMMLVEADAVESISAAEVDVVPAALHALFFFLLTSRLPSWTGAGLGTGSGWGARSPAPRALDRSERRALL